MTISELIAALSKHDPSLEVVVRTETEAGDSFCGGIRTADIEVNCDEVPFFAIDCDEEEDD